LWCTVPAAACLGFLPFNFPRARIFLGDVGSTVLGLWIGYVSLEGARRGAFSFGTALIASSAFALDAGATLGTRMLRGKRWWRAHREHLYQWLHRAGFSHSRVVALYLAWNLLVALPAALLNERIRGMVDASPGAPARLYSWALPVLALALGLTAWAYGKRWCRMRVQGRV
jgi:UDP-N-acetylmuramyl pentapeptide phosphotransferase/UDP-N-acetylglucosamine-1-phosphate transferase